MNYRFVLRNYVDKSGLSQIYLHATQAHQPRMREPIDVQVEKAFWDAKRQRVKDSHPRSLELNLQIDNERSKITTIKTNYHLAGTFLSLDLFREEFLNSAQRTDFVAFMGSQLALDKPEMNPNTYKAQRSVYRKIKKFREQIPFGQIDDDLIKKFKNFIIANGHAATTMNNNLKIFKKYLTRAQDRGLWFPILVKNIKCGPTTGNRVDLDGDEVRRLVSYLKSGFVRENHRVPLALFLLSCFTGIRISDAQALKNENFTDDHFEFTTIKTGKRQKIGINLSLVGLFELCPEVLSVKFTDKHINEKLKEIATVCDISKNVTYHVGRHTFATNYLRMGGRVEILQKILGHSNIRETMIYVHIVQEEQDREILLIDKMFEKDPVSPIRVAG